MHKTQGIVACKKAAVVLAISQLMLLPALAADPETDELKRQLQQALQQLKVLTDRVNQLENAAKAPAASAQSGAVPVASQAPATAPATTELQKTLSAQGERINQLEQSMQQAAAASAEQSEADGLAAGVPLHGFISVGYAHIPNMPNLPNTLNAKSGFSLANVDFYMTPNFGDRLKALMEFNLEYTDQGVLTYDLERFEVGYTFNDLNNVWVGRFHTPFGEWNTAYHHGHYIQTSIDRPRFVAFEDQGGIMPSHTVGIMDSGSLRVNGGDRIAYDFFVGNGSRIVPASDGNPVGIPLGNQIDFNPRGDDNGNVAAGGRLSYDFNNELKVGGNFLTEVINTYDGNNVQQNSTKLNMAGLFYVLDLDSWQSIGEYYSFHNNDLSGPNGNTGTHDSWAAFAQVSYSFDSAWTPYIRAEKAVLDQTDYFFSTQASGRSYDRNVIGLRWDFNRAAALKLEFDRTHEIEVDAPEQVYNRTRLQLDAKF